MVLKINGQIKLWIQCDQIGLLFNPVNNSFSYKSSSIILLLWDYFGTLNFLNVKTAFWTTFAKLGLLFIPTSGHTDCGPSDA